MKQIIAATTNEGKLLEIESLLKNYGYTVISMEQAGYKGDIVENGKTFAENSRIKAKAIHSIYGGYVLADDSGLEIDYLNGGPGVMSARFAGKETKFSEKNAIILSMMNGVPYDKRTAAFVCVITVITPDGSELTAEGRCEGYITSEPKGENGFGYDPIVYIEQSGKTAAQLSDQEKNLISHRGKALRKIAELLP